MYSDIFGNETIINQIQVNCWLTALFLSRRPTLQCSYEKRTPIIIYKIILLTTLKRQQAFTTQYYNYSNAEQFKAVGLENWLYAI